MAVLTPTDVGDGVFEEYVVWVVIVAKPLLDTSRCMSLGRRATHLRAGARRGGRRFLSFVRSDGLRNGVGGGVCVGAA